MGNASMFLHFFCKVSTRLCFFFVAVYTLSVITHDILPCAASVEERKFEPQLSAGRLKELEGIVIFGSSRDCRHIQAILKPQVMNMMPRMVSYLLFPLDTWVITKHLQSQLDASALN
ncbi:hypothetical protein PanWU01x14_047750 [Parasponia andersonii]|uniref:Uncharacterized protein n=1 Tax=Parasponia andersonii TaxID=3476 RepID=A0A2P5DN66_PARAD|nr:hypothetical protein PanWU01x14_047750 [Parasponia andersonii]